MNNIIVSQYLGLGRKKIFNLSEFDGFKISLLPSEYNTYEFVYLIIDNKKSLNFLSSTTETIRN